MFFTETHIFSIYSFGDNGRVIFYPISGNRHTENFTWDFLEVKLSKKILFRAWKVRRGFRASGKNTARSLMRSVTVWRTKWRRVDFYPITGNRFTILAPDGPC